MIKTTISPPDQSELIEFFEFGHCVFQRSNFGAQMDRARMYSLWSEACADCGGTGALDSPEETIRRHKAGEPVRAKCDRCNGCGFVRKKGYRRARRTSKTAGVPVFPTGHPGMRVHNHDPNWSDVERNSRVSRRVREMSPASQRVYQEYFGANGARWDGVHARGRGFAILPLTPSGYALVRSSYEGLDPSKVRPPHEVLHVEADLAELSPQARRRRLLADAWAEAKVMLAKADDDWREARATVAARRTKPEPELDGAVERLLRLVV